MSKPYAFMPRRIDKPWGYELIWAEAEEYVGKVLFVRAGHALSLQYHEQKDESWLVQGGRASLELGQVAGELTTVEIAAGDAFRYRPGTVHRVTAIEDTTILEVSTPHLDDVVRIDDRYGRPERDAGPGLATEMSRDLEPERIVRLEDDAVVVLDQRRLPDEMVELRCHDAKELAEAIKSLAVRGAPAIGVAAAYGIALASTNGHDLENAFDVLAASRPTAVNLQWALDEMRPDPTPERARRLHADEVERCRAMGAHAAGLVPPAARVLTHCNAGGLATGGYGSAVGAIRAASERAGVAHVWVDETRPLLQGARLTAFELEALAIPYAVIVDGAAASRMAAGEVDIVITGADRIAANGDSANKIGTYGLAVLAHHHGIPFVIVAPTSTIDPDAATGAAIPIEERDGAEVTTRFQARNPAFDVTPAALIAAIVTEEGVHRAPYVHSLPTPARSR